jgi:hypothetical protein
MGADNINTAWSLTNLATIVHDQGDLDRARTLLERAVTIREARLASIFRESRGEESGGRVRVGLEG